MSGFEEVRFTWDGVVYSIPPSRMLGAIARIEEHLTFVDVLRISQTQNVPLAKVAAAYASVLRYAGAAVDDAKVYSAMFSVNESESALASVTALLQMMIPPDMRVSGEDKQPGNVIPVKSSSSRKRSKSS